MIEVVVALVLVVCAAGWWWLQQKGAEKAADKVAEEVVVETQPEEEQPREEPQEEPREKQPREEPREKQPEEQPRDEEEPQEAQVQLEEQRPEEPEQQQPEQQPEQQQPEQPEDKPSEPKEEPQEKAQDEQDEQDEQDKDDKGTTEPRASQTVRYCNLCGKSGRQLLRCSQCKLVYYCSRQHQKVDWKDTHRGECLALKEAAARRPQPDPETAGTPEDYLADVPVMGRLNLPLADIAQSVTEGFARATPPVFGPGATAVAYRELSQEPKHHCLFVLEPTPVNRLTVDTLFDLGPTEHTPFLGVPGLDDADARRLFWSVVLHEAAPACSRILAGTLELLMRAGHRILYRDQFLEDFCVQDRFEDRVSYEFVTVVRAPTRDAIDAALAELDANGSLGPDYYETSSKGERPADARATPFYLNTPIGGDSGAVATTAHTTTARIMGGPSFLSATNTEGAAVSVHMASPLPTSPSSDYARPAAVLIPESEIQPESNYVPRRDTLTELASSLSDAGHAGSLKIRLRAVMMIKSLEIAVRSWPVPEPDAFLKMTVLPMRDMMTSDD